MQSQAGRLKPKPIQSNYRPGEINLSCCRIVYKKITAGAAVGTAVEGFTPPNLPTVSLVRRLQRNLWLFR